MFDPVPMVDLGVGTYLSERPSTRYPIYTRGNAGEVWPEVAYPLTISLSRAAGDDAFLRSVLSTGVLTAADVEQGPTCFGGVFGGYMYLNVSVNRVMAIRMPGVSIEQADATFLGSEGLAPPHRPDRRDKNLLATLRAIRYGWKMLNTTSIPELDADRAIVAAWKQRLPELLAGTDEQLVASARAVTEPTIEMFANHLVITGKAGAAMQLLSKLCDEQLGDASLALTLLGGLGEVDSAAPSFALWSLGRMVADDPSLTAQFEAGVDGLAERLAADPDAHTFQHRLCCLPRSVRQPRTERVGVGLRHMGHRSRVGARTGRPDAWRRSRTRPVATSGIARRRADGSRRAGSGPAQSIPTMDVRQDARRRHPVLAGTRAREGHDRRLDPRRPLAGARVGQAHRCPGRGRHDRGPVVRHHRRTRRVRGRSRRVPRRRRRPQGDPPRVGAPPAPVRLRRRVAVAARRGRCAAMPQIPTCWPSAIRSSASVAAPAWRSDGRAWSPIPATPATSGPATC